MEQISGEEMKTAEEIVAECAPKYWDRKGGAQFAIDSDLAVSLIKQARREALEEVLKLIAKGFQEGTPYSCLLDEIRALIEKEK